MAESAIPASMTLELAGSGTQRGLAHGEHFRPVVGDALARWRDAISSREAGQLDSYLDRFLASTGHVDTIRTLSPDLYDEIVAIAAAANQPERDVLAYNLMDEDWRFARGLDTGCSVIGTTLDDGTIMLGQNMDLPSSMDESQVLFRIRASEQAPEQLVLSSAGLIGLLGVNGAGVACCVNTLLEPPGSPDGLPVSVIIREILNHRDAASAAAYVAEAPHASGQHYAIADPSTLRSFECSSDGAVEAPAAANLCHTNHPLWWRASPSDTEPPPPLIEGSVRRLHALEAGLESVQTKAGLRELLSSSADGLCVRPVEGVPALTFCSAEFTLTEPPQVRISLGRPDITDWVSVEWMDAP